VLLGVVVALLGLCAIVVFVVAEDLDEFSAWLLEPSVLLGLLIVDFALLLFRLYAVVDAMRHRRIESSPAGCARDSKERGAGTPTRGKWKLPAVAVGLLILLAFTVFPHVWLGYQYVYRSYDVLTTVFVDETTTTISHSALTPSTVTSITVDPGDDQRLTILFSGSDAGVGREGARSDSNIVASFDLAAGRIALFSIPRNTGNAPLSEAAQKALGMKVWRNWLNELYNSARLHPELAPVGGDPGAVTMRDTVSMILGIPIDYYAQVDMLGFVNLVDILGGVDIYFEKPLRCSISPPTPEEETLVYKFKQGLNHLDGRMALAYSRTRIESSDYVRMGRQRCVIAALIDQTSMRELVWNFPAIMGVFERMVRTDIPIDALQQLVRLRSQLKTDEMLTIAFVKPKYTNGTNHNAVQLGWILDYELIQSTVERMLEHPEEVLAEAKKTGLDTSDCWQKPAGL
jgi:LCP family protein required for cell wall assembly